MLVDLSRTITANMMQVATFPPVEVCRIRSLAEGAPTNVQALRLTGHSGTHIDAPLHVLDGAASIEQLPLERFIGPGVVLAVHKAPRALIDAADLEAAAQGRVRPGDMVFLYTGWDERYGTPAYLTDYPALTLAAADWLLEHGVRLLALDCLSPDLPPERRDPEVGLPVHRRLLGNGVLIAENLTGLGALVGRRLQVYAFPIKIDAGDGAPARITAEIVA
ncbi:MAG TPA: cyclase family protein [Chloroflexota bacterium]|nr:cyclase family protein [Chloroflexota bacterium]